MVLWHVAVLKGCGETFRFHLESSCAHRRVEANTPHRQAWLSAALLAAATGDGRISEISEESAGDRRISCDEGREDEDGREGMGLTGKGTAWDSMNGQGRWEGLDRQPGDFNQPPGATDDDSSLMECSLDQATNNPFRLEQDPPIFRPLSPPPHLQKKMLPCACVSADTCVPSWHVEARGRLPGGSSLLSL